MVNEWTAYDLPTKFDDSRFPRHPWNPSPYLMADLAVWLNEHHPKPGPDRWRRAHSIVEQERDQARESLRRLRDETDFDLFTVRDQLKQCRGERERMTRDRDEWEARADKWHGAWQKSAPNRTVTREDVEKAVRRGHNMLNAEVGVVNEMCDLLGIEAGQATDPVEELAGQIETATRAAIRQVCDDLADVVPSLDPLAVEMAMEVAAASRKVAAHVLGQEDRHVDR